MGAQQTDIITYSLRFL